MYYHVGVDLFSQRQISVTRKAELLCYPERSWTERVVFRGLVIGRLCSSLLKKGGISRTNVKEISFELFRSGLVCMFWS